MTKHTTTPPPPEARGHEVPDGVLALAREIRNLVEAAVHSDVPAAEREAVAAQLAHATERLRVHSHDTPQWVAIADGVGQISVNNPVEGAGNPLAPPLTDFSFTSDSVRANAVLGTPYEGAPGRAHGGWVAALLDHMLGRAAAHAGHPSMTVTLEVEFQRGTPVGVPLTIRAHVTGQDGRKVFAAADVLADGVVTATARALLVEVNGLPRTTVHTE